MHTFFIPLFSTNTVQVIIQLYDFKQRPEDRATLVLSICSSPFTGDIHELHGGRFCVGNQQGLAKVTCAKEVFLVLLDGFIQFNHYSVALV